MIQSIHCHLSEAAILLDLDDQLDLNVELVEWTDKKRQQFKRSILEILVGLLDRSGHVGNPSKLLKDLFHRELKQSTAMGEGFAMPHVRTMQARELTIAIMRSRQGVYFAAQDGLPVHTFVGIICPPYDDKKYLKLLAELSTHVVDGTLMNAIMEAKSARDVMNFFCR